MADPEQLAELLTIADHATQNELLRGYHNWLFNLSLFTALNTLIGLVTYAYLTLHR